MEPFIMWAGIFIALGLAEIAKSLRPPPTEAEKLAQKLAQRRARWCIFGGLGVIVIGFISFCYYIDAKQYFYLEVPGKTLKFNVSGWTKMSDPDPNHALNVSGYNGGERRYDPIYTVYKQPMASTDRVGVKIVEGTYIAFYMDLEGYVTLYTRVDKGAYWVLCRETFADKMSRRSWDLKVSPLIEKPRWKYLLDGRLSTIDIVF
jgi:hypothetical protein